MKKTVQIAAMAVYLFCVTPIFSQVDNSFIKEFVSGNIREKIICIDSAYDSGENYDTLLSAALDFIIVRYALLSEDSDFMELAQSVVQKSTADELLPSLEILFALTDNPDLKKDFLTVFLSAGGQNSEIVNLVNIYAEELLAENTAENDAMLLLTVQALGNFADISSFSVLFDCYAYSENKEISDAAAVVLDSFVGQYENQVRKIISAGTDREKYFILQLVLKNNQNSDFFKAEMSEKALETTINTIGDISSVNNYTIALQMAAIRELQRISWTRSGDLITQFFLVAKEEFEAELLTPEQFSEVIFVFARLSSRDASDYLSACLEEFNMLQEENISYSKPVVLAVIQSLGLLGNKVAFDPLLYATYLDYSEDIILAARDALAALKW
ncbi:MAG: hypothetical protein R3Y36_00440 [Spirochaetales bacterium]